MERWFNPQAMGSSPDLASPLAGIFGGIGAGLDAYHAAKRDQLARQKALADIENEKAKQALEGKKSDLYGQQIQAQIANQKRQERRDQIKFGADEAKRREGVSRDIAKALGGGRPGEAQMIANSSQFEGPDGTMQGVQMSRVPNPVAAPEPVLKPQAPDFVGPLEDPEDARARAVFEGLRPQNGAKPGQVFVDQTEAGNAHLLGGPKGEEPFDYPSAKLGADATEGAWIPDPRAVPSDEQGAAALQAGDAAAAEVQKQQAARDKFGMDQRSYEGRSVQAYHQQQEHNRNEANPQYRVSYPGGGSDVIDPREARMAAASEAKDRADRLRQAASAPGQAPDVAASMMRQADLIESQISNADKAPITNMASTVQSQGFKAGENAKDRTLKRQLKAKGVAKGLGVPQPGSKEYQKEETQLEGELKTYDRDANLVGPKGLGENQRALTEAAATAGREDQNPANQIIILDKLLRSASGLGVRAQTLQTYRDHLTGLIGKGEGVAEHWLTGREGSEAWNNVKGAINDQLSQSQAAGGEENARFHRAYDNSPLAKRHPDLLKRHEVGAFSSLHGYGQKAPTPSVAPAATTKVTMPDGTIQEFDASGKRVK